MGVLSGSGVEIRPVDTSGKQKLTGFFDLGDKAVDNATEQACEAILEKVTGEFEKLFAIYNLILAPPDTRIMDDEDWATSWQQFFATTEIVPGLVIKPSWEEYAPDAGQRVITMDPGMAFGTGLHSSTRLALSLIASCFDTEHDNKPRRVLDVGTGTGILAMAAAVFGADEIMAIDNDPEAVTVATHNVLANHFDWNIGVSIRPVDALEGPYDLICVNIVHDVLVAMAPTIERLARNNSLIILSGILHGDQENNLEQVYRNNGMRLVRSEQEEEWTALLLQKAK